MESSHQWAGEGAGLTAGVWSFRSPSRLPGLPPVVGRWPLLGAQVRPSQVGARLAPSPQGDLLALDRALGESDPTH